MKHFRLITLAVLFCCVLLGRSHLGSISNYIKNAVPTPLPTELLPVQQHADDLHSLHLPKRAPGPDDWLSHYPEAGQSFAQYVSGRRQRPIRDDYQTIYVVSLGTFSDRQCEILRLTGEFVSLYYGLRVQQLPAIEFESRLPKQAQRMRSEGHRQLDAGWLQESLLLPQRPADAVAVIGFTSDDIWAGDLNFVFGMATPEERLGVWSMHRLGDPETEFRRCLWRTLQTAVHETGHILGFPHCTAFECCMNGSANREESDRQPLELCPECQAKVWWTCRVSREQRWRDLQLFAEANGLEAEQRVWEKHLRTVDADVGLLRGTE